MSGNFAIKIKRKTTQLEHRKKKMGKKSVTYVLLLSSIYRDLSNY